MSNAVIINHYLCLLFRCGFKACFAGILWLLEGRDVTVWHWCLCGQPLLHKHKSLAECVKWWWIKIWQWVYISLVCSLCLMTEVLYFFFFFDFTVLFIWKLQNFFVTMEQFENTCYNVVPSESTVFSEM